MSTDSHAHHGPKTFADAVREHTGEAVEKCYQCGKCTAGCPLAEEMDLPPSRLLRLLQVGLPGFEERALRSYSIWLCLTCETCFVRCPKEVGLPKIMDYLRSEALRRKIAHPKAKDIVAFHKSFLKSIRKGGRLHEVGLVADYKRKTLHLTQDVTLAPRMMARGKLHLLARKIRGRKQVAGIFRRALDKE